MSDRLVRLHLMLRNLTERYAPLAYAMLRIAFGLIVLTHGLPKLLGESHGSMGDPFAASLNLIRNVMGLPFPVLLAYLVMALETVGAVMLVLGLATRLVALALAGEMVGISVALGPTWPWIDRGIEYPVLMAFLSIYMAIRGAGRLSLDEWLLRRIG